MDINLTANVVLLSALPPQSTTLSIDVVFPFGNRAIAGEIFGEEHLLSSLHSLEALSYSHESSEGHGPPVPWPLPINNNKNVIVGDVFVAKLISTSSFETLSNLI